MTASTPFIEMIPPELRYGIALSASLVAHGAFAWGVPYFNLYSKPVTLPSPVQVVELTPEQLSRVYPAPPPQLSFTPLDSLSPSLSVLPVPSTDNIISPPTPEDFVQGESLPVWPTDIPFPPPNAGTQSFPTYRLPPVVSPETNSGNIDSGSIGFQPPPGPSIGFVPGPDLSLSNSNGNSPTFPGNNQSPNNNLPPSDEMALRQQLIRELGQDVDCPPMFNNPHCTPPANSDAATPAPENPGNNTPTQNNPDLNQGQGSILAKLENDLQQRQQTANTANETPEVPETPTGSVSENQTAMLQGGGAYVEWVTGLLASYPNLQTTSPQSVSALYPASACEQKLEGKALIGVVVGENGAIIQGPERLLGTGHGVLDQAAEEAVRNVAFEASSQPKVYQFQFQFNSENCQSVNNQDSAEPVQPQTPPTSPTSNSSPTTQPTAEVQQQPTNSVEEKPSELEQPTVEAQQQPVNSNSVEEKPLESEEPATESQPSSTL